MTLFQGASFSDVLQSRLNAVCERVSRMSLSELRNPALAGHLEKQWSAGKANIPVLDRAGKSGSRGEVAHRREDYGREVTVQTTVVDVRVPFRGDAQMFQVRPSTSSILNEQVDAHGGHLHYMMPFDVAAEPRYEKMLDQIEGNLTRLRTEAEQFDRYALQELERIADERRKKLEAEEKKAAGFSFKVD